MKVLVTGSMAYDVLLSYDGIFADNLSGDVKESLSVIYLSSHYARHHGGTAANIAWNLQLLDTQPVTVATVGADGGEYIALLQKRGIDTTHIERIEKDVTSTAIIGTDSNENQIGFFHAGADRNGTWPDMDGERENISYAIVSPRDENVMMQAVAWCKQQKVPYIFDPSQRITSMSDDDLLRALDGSFALTVNEYEWSVVSERLNVTEENIKRYTNLLVVTRSENGITYFDEKGGHTIPSCIAEKVINPTGAGDAMRAGFLSGLNAGWDIRDSLRLGASMGSFAVETEGTLLHDIDKDMVFERAQKAYDEPMPMLT